MKNPEARKSIEDQVLKMLSNKSSDFDQLYSDPVFNFLFQRSSTVALVYHFPSRSFKFISANFKRITGCDLSGLNKLSLIEFTNTLFEENTASLFQKIIYPKILKYYNEYTLQRKVDDLKITFTSKIKSKDLGWVIFQMNILEVNNNGYPVSSIMFITNISEVKNNNLIDFAIYQKNHSTKSFTTLYNISYPLEKTYYDFSPREYEIIFFLKEGKTSKQIASILQLSAHTVDTYRRKILKKTEVLNMTDLIRRMIEEGTL